MLPDTVDLANIRAGVHQEVRGIPLVLIPNSIDRCRCQRGAATRRKKEQLFIGRVTGRKIEQGSSLAMLRETVRECVGKVSGEEWVTGGQWDASALGRWEDEEGNKRSTVEVVAREMIMLGDRRKDDTEDKRDDQDAGPQEEEDEFPF